MLSIDVNHPDIFEFTNIKKDLTKITGANISIRLNDNFLKAVKNDEDYILRYPCDLEVNIQFPDPKKLEYNKLIILNSDDPKKRGYIKKIKARELWDNIITNAHLTAEPGIFNWERLINYDPTGVYDKLKPISTNPCQPSWATVLTPFGIKQFNDITIGDLIWSKEGWTRIINKQSSGIKNVYEYRTTGGSFYGTENHKVISKGNKIEAKDAESIDIINGNIEPDITMKANFHNAIIDGLVLGDGSVHKASNNLIYLCIGENDSDYFNSEVQLYIGEHRPGIKPYAYEVKTTIQPNELPLTYERRIPERYFYADNWTVRKFLKGLFSANGSVVGNRITLKTSSPILRDEIQILLSSVGIRSYYTTNKSKEVEFSNGIYNCKESYDVNITTDRGIFYDNIGFLQNYKMNKLKDTLNNVRESDKTHDIISTNFISCEEVFDITVDNKSHTYWTGGVNVSNCGELGLSGYDSCRLIATNLYSLVDNPFIKEATINYDRAYEIFYEAQVLADNLVDLELEAVDRILNKISPNWKQVYNSFNIENKPHLKNIFLLKHSDEFKLWWKIREVGSQGRRTGTGITAYADMLAALGVKYGDTAITDRIFKIKLQAELDASIDMAIIRGAFPLSNSELEMSYNDGLVGSNDWYQFIIDNFPEQAYRMYKYGRRNAGISTIAPTGSVSILTQTSSGIEPVFLPLYTRKVTCHSGETPDIIEQGIGYKEVPMVHPKLKTWYEITGYGILEQHLGEGLDKIPKVDELTKSDWEYLYQFSPYYQQDSASIDYNTRIETQALIQKYITSSISSTVNLPKETPKEVVEDLYLKAFDLGCKGITVYREGSRKGILVSDTSNEKSFNQHEAPERGKELEANLHITKSKGNTYAVIVGLKEGKPYEVFVFNTLGTNLKECSGKIIKVKKRHYKFESDEIIIDNIDENGNTELERACALYTSMLLRHGANIHYVVKTAKKINDSITSFVSAMCRILNKYDNIKEVLECPKCGGRLIKESGCDKCLDCGESKCN